MKISFVIFVQVFLSLENSSLAYKNQYAVSKRLYFTTKTTTENYNLSLITKLLI